MLDMLQTTMHNVKHGSANKEAQMYQVFTQNELEAKGIAKRDVEKLLKSTETRIKSYVKQYAKNGNVCSPGFKKSWDAECRRWDHLKSTLNAMQ